MTIVMMAMKTRRCRMRSACELKSCVVPVFGIVSIYFNLHPYREQLYGPTKEVPSLKRRTGKRSFDQHLLYVVTLYPS